MTDEGIILIKMELWSTSKLPDGQAAMWVDYREKGYKEFHNEWHFWFNTQR